MSKNYDEKTKECVVSSLKKKLAQWVPKYVSTKLIVAVYGLLNFLCLIGRKKREQNFRHNLSLLEVSNSPLKEGYIENQNQWGNIRFGKTTMAFAGCEIMAVYNALMAMRKDNTIDSSDCELLRDFGGCESICRLISDFEKDGAALQGWIGSSPYSIKRYLKKHGIRTRFVWKMDKLSDAKVAIATVYNDAEDLYSQIHTIAFSKEEDGYMSHNALICKRGCQTLKEAVKSVSNNPKMICAIEILK